MLILISVAITNISLAPSKTFPQSASVVSSFAASQGGNALTFEKSSTPASFGEIKKLPSRNWNVLDPNASAQSVLIQSLDDHFPFFHFNTYKTWPTASLAKLLTAVVVLEDIGENKKIAMTERAISTEGLAGELAKDEEYGAQDLLKIMLLASSNDAATAFEDYTGGQTEFTRLLNQKAKKIGMNQTTLYDASGLSELNQSVASDLLKLTQYILKEHPDIFNWTRLPQIIVQPTNDYRSHIVKNINNFRTWPGFFGGKTGTSEEAKENAIVLFSRNDVRIAAIILGSPNRAKELEMLLRWIDEAYVF